MADITIPGRSVIDMSVETMANLAHDHENIVGTKDATAKMDRVSMQRQACGQDFIQLSGEDATALGFNAHGGVGCISVTANVAPELMAGLCQCALAGDRAEAEKINNRLAALNRALFLEANPIPVKWALAQRGLIEPGIRLPLTELDARYHGEVLAAMEAAGV